MSMRPCYSLFFLLLSLVVQVNLQVDINSVDLLITIIRRAIWTRMLGGFLNVSPSYPRYLLFEATKNLKQSDNAEKIKIVHFVWHYPLFVRTVILQGLDAVRRAVLQKRVVEGRFPKIQQRFSEIRPTPSRKQFFATPPRSSTYPRKMAIFSELPSLESSLTLAAQAKPSLLSHPAPASTLWWDTISLFSPQICKWALSSRQGSEPVLPGLQLNRGQRTTPTLASGLFFSFWFWHSNIFKGRQRQMWPLRISTTTPRLIQWWTPTGWRRRM